MRELRHGMRVRLKTRAPDGWQGEATVVEVLGNRIVALRDDYFAEGDWWSFHEGEVEALRHEWAILRDQEPNPCHEAALAPRAGDRPLQHRGHRRW